MAETIEKVSFRRMDEGTREEYERVMAHEDLNIAAQVDRVIGWLKEMDNETVYQVTRLEHALQSATRAEADGEDEEMIVCALLHDIGDILAPANHSQAAAALLRPYVSEKNAWIIEHHGLFQGYYYFHHLDKNRNERDRYKDHPWFDDCVRFCERWDQTSFDPDYESKPLEYFEPMVRRLFAKAPADFV